MLTLPIFEWKHCINLAVPCRILLLENYNKVNNPQISIFHLEQAIIYSTVWIYACLENSLSAMAGKSVHFCIWPRKHLSYMHAVVWIHIASVFLCMLRVMTHYQLSKSRLHIRFRTTVYLLHGNNMHFPGPKVRDRVLPLVSSDPSVL